MRESQVSKVKLTEKQKRFCDYFIETGNATEASIRSGYSPKTARCIGRENLAKPVLRKYIDERLQAKEDARIAKQDEVLIFLTSVMRGEVVEKIPISSGDVQELRDKPLDGKDRIKAAELLGKRYAIWTDRQQLEGTIGVQIIDDIGAGDEDEQDSSI